CVFQALGPDLAGLADLLRLARGAALLVEERLRVGLRAQGALLPAQIVVCAVRQRDDLAHAHLLLPPMDVPSLSTPGRGKHTMKLHARRLLYVKRSARQSTEYHVTNRQRRPVRGHAVDYRALSGAGRAPGGPGAVSAARPL